MTDLLPLLLPALLLLIIRRLNGALAKLQAAYGM